VVGQEGSVIEVDGRLGRGPSDIWVRGKVDDGIVAMGDVGEVLEVLHVALHDVQPWLAYVSRQVPIASRGEVVEYRDSLHGRIGEEPIREVAPDEPRTTDDQIGRRHRLCSNDTGRHLGRSVCRLPSGRPAGECGMRDEEVPDDGAQALRVRRYPFRNERRDDDDRVRDPRRVAPVPSDDPEDRSTDAAGELERPNEVRRDVSRLVATTN